MDIREETLRRSGRHGSGEVRRISLPGSGTRVTRITTFCPEGVGPGPTNLYLIEADKLILVDTGLPTHLLGPMFFQAFGRPVPSWLADLPADLSLQELESGLNLAGHGLEEIELIVLTHGHWDHFLLARTLLKRNQAQVTAHLLDTPMLCNPWAILMFWEQRRAEARTMDLPQPPPLNRELVGRMNQAGMRLGLSVDRPVIEEGPLPEEFGCAGVETIHIPGHSPGSLGLLVGPPEERLLISGDVILTPISPIPHELLAYLTTLTRLQGMENVALTLPAHGEVIRELGVRAAFLVEHHRLRLQKTYLSCAEPVSAWQVGTVPGYYDVEIDPAEYNFLAGREAYAHLDLLRQVNLVEMVDIRRGAHIFRAKSRDFEAGWERIRTLAGAGREG